MKKIVIYKIHFEGDFQRAHPPRITESVDYEIFMQKFYGKYPKIAGKCAKSVKKFFLDGVFATGLH